MYVPYQDLEMYLETLKTIETIVEKVWVSESICSLKVKKVTHKEGCYRGIIPHFCHFLKISREDGGPEARRQTQMMRLLEALRPHINSG